MPDSPTTQHRMDGEREIEREWSESIEKRAAVRAVVAAARAWVEADAELEEGIMDFMYDRRDEMFEKVKGACESKEEASAALRAAVEKLNEDWPRATASKAGEGEG